MADQYNSNFTGPEIDAILGGSVRYDLAQSLTAAEQTQARSNINAAPGGYGYGDNAQGFFSNPDSDGSVATAFFDKLLAQMSLGVTIRGSFVDYPYIVDTANGGEYELFKGSATSAIVTITVFGGGGYGPYRLTWTKYNNTWRVPEWVNPPMQSGVEYRTTERYKGKPVYIRLEEIAALPNNSTLTVSNVGVPSGGKLYVDNIVDYRAEFYSNSAVYSIPYNDVVDVLQCNGSRYGGGITYSIRTKVDYSSYAARIWIKYTKQTD